MSTVFSAMLVQLRKDAGYPTAYKFYHNNGGLPVLKMSYRSYLMAEQGRSLPEIERLGTLIWALKLISKCAKANALAAAWLKTMAGADTFRDIFEPLMGAVQDTQKLSPMQEAMKKVLAAKKYTFTVRQTEAIYDSEATYLCHLALANDAAAWPVKELAASLELTVPAAKKALGILAAAKLVKQVKKDVYKSRVTGIKREFPHMNILPKELYARIFKMDKQLEGSGEMVFLSQEIARADSQGFRNFFSMLEGTVSTATAYSVTEKSDKTALFMVEGKVTRLRNF